MEIIRLDIFLACNNISSSYNRRDRDRKYHWREWERQRYSRAKKKKNSVGQEGTSTAADRSVIASTFIGKLADSCLKASRTALFHPILYTKREEDGTVSFDSSWRKILEEFSSLSGFERNRAQTLDKISIATRIDQRCWPRCISGRRTHDLMGRSIERTVASHHRCLNETRDQLVPKTSIPRVSRDKSMRQTTLAALRNTQNPPSYPIRKISKLNASRIQGE